MFAEILQIKILIGIGSGISILDDVRVRRGKEIGEEGMSGNKNCKCCRIVDVEVLAAGNEGLGYISFATDIQYRI